jgi:hypothetical protein
MNLFFNINNIQDVNDDGVWFESHFTTSKTINDNNLVPYPWILCPFMVNLNINLSIQIKRFITMAH